MGARPSPPQGGRSRILRVFAPLLHPPWAALCLRKMSASGHPWPPSSDGDPGPSAWTRPVGAVGHPWARTLGPPSLPSAHRLLWALARGGSPLGTHRGEGPGHRGASASPAWEVGPMLVLWGCQGRNQVLGQATLGSTEREGVCGEAGSPGASGGGGGLREMPGPLRNSQADSDTLQAPFLWQSELSGAPGPQVHTLPRAPLAASQRGSPLVRNRGRLLSPHSRHRPFLP